MEIVKIIGAALMTGLGGTIGYLPGLLPMEYSDDGQGFPPRQ